MDLSVTLDRLADLLDHHVGNHAVWLRTLHGLDESAVYAALNSKRLWGGAGSIAAC